MNPRGRRHALGRRLLLVGLVGLLLPLPVASGSEHAGLSAPAIPYPGAGNDTLALLPRAWQVTTGPAPGGVDLEGASEGADGDVMAFRLLADITALEGVLTVPDAQGRLEPLANIGVRWHAVTFDPPIRFADGQTLRQVTPGALTWTVPNVSAAPRPGTDVPVYTTWTSVPIPTNGTTAPDPETSRDGHEPDPDAAAWLVWWASFAPQPAPDPETVVRSPAMVRFGAGVWVNGSAVANRGVLLETTATVTWHHDFGAVARGVAVRAPPQVNVTGLYLERGTFYTAARAFGTAHGWGADADRPGRPVIATTSFSVPPYGRLPESTPRSLLSPITFNVTVPLVASSGNTTPWRVGADGPMVSGHGHGFLVRGGLGFMADGSLIETPTSRDRDDDGNVTPPTSDTERFVPGGLVALVALVAGGLLLRRRRR